MAFLQQLFLLPYVHVWFPGVIFLAVAVVAYCCLQRYPQLASSAPPAEVDEPSGLVVMGASRVPAKAENRVSSRRQGNPIEVYVAHPERKEDPERACVLDRSMGGMRLAATHEIVVGTVLSIRPVHADAMVPWFDLEVRSCRPSAEVPGEFELGCQFVKSPPYSILLLFG